MSVAINISRIKELPRTLLRWLGSVFLCLLCLEGLLRCVFVRQNHIEYLFGKKWHYLVPFDTPLQIKERQYLKGLDLLRYDSQLGWTVAENAHAKLYFSDEKGYRISKHDFLNPAAGKSEDSKRVDIVAIGDSFTYGHLVSQEETWPYLLEKETGYNVVNLGVNGYGMDQAILRFQYSQLRPKYVILGIIPENLERSETGIYGFTSGELHTKPFFVFDGAEPRIANQPCLTGDQVRNAMLEWRHSELFKEALSFHPWFFERGKSDISYLIRFWKSYFLWQRDKKRSYQTPGDRLDYNIKIIAYADRIARAAGAKLILLLLSSETDLKDYRKNRFPWRVFEEELKKIGVPYVNAADRAFDQYQNGGREMFLSDGHYSPSAYRVIIDSLTSSGLLTAGKVSGTLSKAVENSAKRHPEDGG